MSGGILPARIAVLAASILVSQAAASQSLEETVLFMMTGISSEPPYKVEFTDTTPAYTQMEYKLNVDGKCKFVLDIHNTQHFAERKRNDGVVISQAKKSLTRTTYEFDMSKVAEISYEMKPHVMDNLSASLDDIFNKNGPRTKVRNVPTIIISGAKDAICMTSYPANAPPVRGCTSKREWQFYHEVPSLPRFQRAYQHYTKSFCPPRLF